MNAKKSSVGRLNLRHVAVDTYHENVAYMHRDCEIYRAEGFQALAQRARLPGLGRHGRAGAGR